MGELQQKQYAGKRRFTIYDMAIVGVMAAICFVVTYFIKIEVPSPAGTVMLKLANGFCLLAGALFGGIRGGLAAGFGSMLYDLLDPKYITDAPLTLIRFFLMAFLCGIICWSGKKKGESFVRNLIGATAGSLFSLLFYFVQSVIKQLLLGQPFDVAVIQTYTKLGVSTINAVLGVVVVCLLALPMHAALKRAGLYRQLHLGEMDTGRIAGVSLLLAGIGVFCVGAFQVISALAQGSFAGSGWDIFYSVLAAAGLLAGGAGIWQLQKARRAACLPETAEKPQA